MDPLARGNPPAVSTFDLSALECRFGTLKDKRKLSGPEKECLWRISVEMLNEAIDDGHGEAEAKVKLARCFDRYAVALAKNELAFIRNLERKHAQWVRAGSVRDRRAEVNKLKRAPALSQEDRDTLVRCAVWEWEGNLDRAWAECVSDGRLSAAPVARYPLGKRPRCPKAIRRQVAAEIRRLMQQHIRPRHARLNGPYITCDYGKLCANDVHSSDDITLPVYYWVEHQDGHGYFTRGQFLPMIDVKSKRILDFALRDGKSYDAPTIRTLINRVSTKYGLPNIGWHFECGIWKNALLLGNGKHQPELCDLENNFAERLGLKIRHSLPGNARAKVIENVAGLLQDLMAGEPGYVGRDEQNVKYERVRRAMLDVESGRKTFREAGFYSDDEWIRRLDQLCAEYNSRKQQSRVIGNYLSPDEAWEKFQQRDSTGQPVGIVKLPDEMRYLLASHVQPVKVGRNGVAISLSGKTYRYKGEATGELQGEAALAWFDCDDPTVLIISDLKKERFWSVPQDIPIPAFDATADQLTAANSANADHRAPIRSRYSDLKAGYMAPARPVVIEPGAREKAREISQARERGKIKFEDNQRMRSLESQPMSRPGAEDPLLREFYEEELKEFIDAEQ